LEPGDELGSRFLINDRWVKAAWAGCIRRRTVNLAGNCDQSSALGINQRRASHSAFKHELLLASRISHRNILRIHDLSEADGVKFITMAYVEART